MKKTLFDLYISAHKAATASVGAPSSFAIENAKLEAFNADANDPADWDYWSQQFENIRRNINVLKSQPAPSAKIAAAKPATPAPSTTNQ